MIDLNKQHLDQLANEALAQQILDAPQEYYCIEEEDYDDINLDEPDYDVDEEEDLAFKYGGNE